MCVLTTGVGLGGGGPGGIVPGDELLIPWLMDPYNDASELELLAIHSGLPAFTCVGYCVTMVGITDVVGPCRTTAGAAGQTGGRGGGEAQAGWAAAAGEERSAFGILVWMWL